MAELFLLLGLLFVIGHVILDAYLAVKKLVHPKDSLLTYFSVIFLVGHVVLSGEIVEVKRVIGF